MRKCHYVPGTWRMAFTIGDRGVTRPLEKARATLHLFILLFSLLTFNASQYVRQVSLSNRVGKMGKSLSTFVFLYWENQGRI